MRLFSLIALKEPMIIPMIPNTNSTLTTLLSFTTLNPTTRQKILISRKIYPLDTREERIAEEDRVEYP